MSLLQVHIDTKLKKAIQQQATRYRVPASSLIKIVLSESFLPRREKMIFLPGNIFNAGRDTDGKGIPLKTFLNAL